MWRLLRPRSRFLLAATVLVLAVLSMSVREGESTLSSPLATVSGTLNPGDTNDYSFTIPSDLDDSLIHVIVTAVAPDSDRLDIAIDADAWNWFDIQGDWWGTVGPLAGGVHTFTATPGLDAANPLTFTVQFYEIPSPPFTIQGTFPAQPYNYFVDIDVSIPEPGSYEVSAYAQTGNFAIFIGDDEIDVVGSAQGTVEFTEAGVYWVTVEADFLGTGEATAWSMTIGTPASTTTGTTTTTESSTTYETTTSAMTTSTTETTTTQTPSATFIATSETRSTTHAGVITLMVAPAGAGKACGPGPTCTNGTAVAFDTSTFPGFAIFSVRETYDGYTFQYWEVDGNSTSLSESGWSPWSSYPAWFSNPQQSHTVVAVFNPPAEPPAQAQPQPEQLPSCIIATAAYGSETAPEVVYMRYVRDNLIGSTSIGRALRDGFLTWYYWWSPPIAHYMSDKPVFQAVFRVLLAPVSLSVRIADATFHAVGGGDLGSVLGFTFAAAFSILSYIVIPSVLLVLAARWNSRLRRTTQSHADCHDA